ncbi:MULTISPECIES: OsmC family protein [Oceanobacillus]|uniref:Peroxiredoxin n=1 Tax=Oceanobacillus kimchii TaxID=746691 RepID=A0ABQ5TQK8_9BACI|nr:MULTISPECIES: OsmC family protein [Oceanobacillus]MBT2600400.1 OsmC family protein [Oceanobacillus sp. ISL-74]MBT2650558.1 OsmC family protein [Oceanobacillus sp. ISL-73]MCT1578299.1 OsmC family protein [Oceanobacillus kimchii]MCT2134477.1 OsmC family protein [Oceanobacillus kimchii]OEH54899.1 peroxiredoxin [Oceanobacillus sp. E9]
MKVTTKWTGGRAFTATGDSGYEINMDATEAYGGLGKGATPTEMLLSSLAGCIGIDVTMILRPHLDKITKIEIETDGIRKEEAPKGFTDIVVTFIIDGDIDSKKVWRAINLGEEKYCSVSDSLKANISFELILNGESKTI